MPIQTSLVGEFRRLVQDTRPSVRSFGFGLTSIGSNATLEIRNGHFMVSVTGGSAPNADLLLADPRFNTIGGLIEALRAVNGYMVAEDEDASREHTSIDITPVGPVPILDGRSVSITHHLFSDFELEELLSRAIQRHNPTFTIETLPPQENDLVMTLARSAMCKAQAYDASKRKGLAATVADLLAIATSLEEQYASDVSRLARVIQSPREANPNLVDEGDVMLGRLSRRSLRTGYVAPVSAVIPPDPVILLDAEDHDVEDDNVKVRWEKNGNYDFYSYELWMDATSDVVRGYDTGLAIGTGGAYIPNNENGAQGVVRPTSSQLAVRALGANSNSPRSGYSSFVEEYGQSVTAFAVGPLEPSTTYFFRLYASNLNYISRGSNVIEVRTKALRARFLPLGREANRPGPTGDFSNVKIGPAGTSVILTLDPTCAAFTVDHVLRIGGKVVTPVITNAGFSLTVTIPTFAVIGQKDFVIQSPNKLVDVRSNAFQVTA